MVEKFSIRWIVLSNLRTPGPWSLNKPGDCEVNDMTLAKNVLDTKYSQSRWTFDVNGPRPFWKDLNFRHCAKIVFLACFFAIHKRTDKKA